MRYIATIVTVLGARSNSAKNAGRRGCLWDEFDDARVKDELPGSCITGFKSLLVESRPKTRIDSGVVEDTRKLVWSPRPRRRSRAMVWIMTAACSRRVWMRASPKVSVARRNGSWMDESHGQEKTSCCSNGTSCADGGNRASAAE